MCNYCDGDGYIVEYCRVCNGSGEGMHDGSVCPECKGSGEEIIKCDCDDNLNV